MASKKPTGSKTNLRDRNILSKPARYKDSTNKHKINEKKTNNPPEDLYCNQCGVFIDNINHFHYVYEDDFGSLDVCENCFDDLTYYKPPNQNNNASGILANPPIGFNSSTPTGNDDKEDECEEDNRSDKRPKISLVFIAKGNHIKPDDNTTDVSNKDKDKDKDKDKNNKKTTQKEKHNKKTSDKGNVGSGLTDGDPGLLFFQQILNRLHNVDDSATSFGCCSPPGSGAKYTPESVTCNGEETDTEEEDPTTLEYEWLGDNIETIDDLIAFGKTYDSRKRKRYNLNLKQLNRLVEPLCQLRDMVGMQDVKKIIFDQLIYYLQNLDDKNVDMLHTVITGPPGVGKTQLTHIIAKIYNRLGFLKTDKVISVKRDDLIGEYIGQTAPKTRKVLERALGGVLLLDEIYSLAPTSDRDFAREAIDMINMYLSEHAHDLVCVVAGYKKPTYEKFFGQNEGLARRFTHHFEIKGYDAPELAQIFNKYLESQKWSLAATMTEVADIIKNHMDIFPNFGGDMMTLFACCKKAHSRRLLVIPTEAELNAIKKKIQKNDILEAIGIYKAIKEKHSSSEEENKTKYMHMYV